MCKFFKTCHFICLQMSDIGNVEIMLETLCCVRDALELILNYSDELWNSSNGVYRIVYISLLDSLRQCEDNIASLNDYISLFH